MADIIFVILLILHITFVVIWAGGAILFSMIVAPSLAKISPTSRTEFVIATLPRYTKFIAVSATGSILVGILLFGYITRVATSYAPSSSGLPFIETGALLGLVAFVIAVDVVYPTASKLVKKLKAMPKDSSSALEVSQLQKKLRVGATLAAGILALTLILMVIGASI